MTHQTLESGPMLDLFSNDMHVCLAISGQSPERCLKASTPQRITPTRVGALLENRHANQTPSFFDSQRTVQAPLPARLSNEDEDRLFRERGKRQVAQLSSR
ncbi:uncharacterized protein P174DRAFT_178605 [Aspergillus novofumigatus IBT 16806]|uniref:Uncharacterized protein n=1 Tax=Aspergillus novofumigatus (strain IBT 16806) TaxID=1392255 RepID=A0A2I1C9K2_ASPN1|nr:uncharacterized protein P174DRAFT_178605 [Aspergillus novofumigatus IBT 16806]PKX94310.1 hypothetical protein P174DRAFT_178605 [Aspergillus novofumigatus IBT 16806]